MRLGVRSTTPMRRTGLTGRVHPVGLAAVVYTANASRAGQIKVVERSLLANARPVQTVTLFKTLDVDF